MANKAGWTLAILIALIVSGVPQLRAEQAQVVSVGPGYNSLEGDLSIVSVDNRPVRDNEDLRNALSALQPDNRVYLTVFQLLPNGARKTFKIAFSVGNTNRAIGPASTITAKQNAPQSEEYYEMISGCVNCVIQGVALGGVGVQLIVNDDDSVAPAVKRGLFTVTTPAKNTAADRAGLKLSDQIVKINGEPVSNIPLMEAIKRLREPKGSDVTLTIARTVGPEESFTVTLPRW